MVTMKVCPDQALDKARKIINACCVPGATLPFSETGGLLSESPLRDFFAALAADFVLLSFTAR